MVNSFAWGSARDRRQQMVQCVKESCVSGQLPPRAVSQGVYTMHMPICAVLQAAHCFTFAELSLIGVRLPLCAVTQGSSLCLSARYRRLHMIRACQTIFTHCLTPALRSAYACLCGIAGCICFTFAELSLIVVRLPLCAVSQGSSLCLSARYRRLHMLYVGRITMDLCPTPATHGIAGCIHIWWILCTVPIAGCICVFCRQHNLSININQLLFCAVWDRLPSLAYICEPALCFNT